MLYLPGGILYQLLLPSILFLPDTGGQSINDNPKNLTGVSPAERHIIYASTISFIPDQLPCRQEKNLTNERNVQPQRKLREGPSERTYSPCPSIGGIFSRLRRTYRDQQEMAELMRHPIAPTAVRPNRRRPVTIPASDPLDKDTHSPVSKQKGAYTK